jgi:hypothetical protein
MKRLVLFPILFIILTTPICEINRTSLISGDPPNSENLLIFNFPFCNSQLFLSEAIFLCLFILFSYSQLLRKMKTFIYEYTYIIYIHTYNKINKIKK